MPTTTPKKKPATKVSKRVTKKPRLHLVRDPVSGLLVLPAQPGRRPVTSEEVARALADFP